MSQKALALLEHIIREKPNRENRLADLLKDPSTDFAEG